MNPKKIIIILLYLVLTLSLSSCKGDNEQSINSNFLNERINGYTSVRQLLTLTDDQDIDYAGRYILTDENTHLSTMHICLVYSSAKGIEEKELLKRIDVVNSAGVIRIVDAHYSIYELEKAHNTLSKSFKKLGKQGLRGIGIDASRNRVLITVEESTEALRSSIEKLVNPSMIIIEEGYGGIVLTDNKLKN